MLTLAQNIILLLVTVTASMIFMVLLNRIWPPAKRRAHNDIIGWQLGILGTTYAVILGFMLYTVWTTFGEANLNADLEANSLRNVYRLAEGLPDGQRTQIEALCRSYADAVVSNDWPEMASGRIPEKSHFVNQDMWRTLMSVKAASPSELLAEDHAISELSSMTEHRRTRLLQSAYKLPAVFWWVLVVGAVLTIVSSSLFGAGNTALHTVQVFSFTLLITLVLLAIDDVNLPFRGWVHVSDYAFQRALSQMSN